MTRASAAFGDFGLRRRPFVSAKVVRFRLLEMVPDVEPDHGVGDLGVGVLVT